MTALGCARFVGNSQAPDFYSSDRSLETKRDAAFSCERGGRNITQEFSDRLHAAVTGDPASKTFSQTENCDVVLVHGWLGEVALRATDFLDKFNRKQHILDYLKDQRIAARELGLATLSPLYRSDSIDICGEKLAAFIIANPRPVILIAHSKGCVDALAALLSLQRSGHLNKVRGWLSMQGPYYGCDEAETFFSHSMPLSTLRFKLLGGKLAGVTDMRPALREEYMAQHRAEIESIVRSTPVICFGSWLQPTMPGEPLKDGPISPESAILSGSDYIAKCGIRHAAPVLGWGDPQFDRVAFNKTMLVMLLERIHAPLANR